MAVQATRVTHWAYWSYHRSFFPILLSFLQVKSVLYVNHVTGFRRWYCSVFDMSKRLFWAALVFKNCNIRLLYFQETHKKPQSFERSLRNSLASTRKKTELSPRTTRNHSLNRISLRSRISLAINLESNFRVAFPRVEVTRCGRWL